MMANPDDILVVAWPEEARLHPQFSNSQVFPVSRPEKLTTGKSFRVAWVTRPADVAVNARFWSRLYEEAFFCDGEIKEIGEYEENQ